MARALATLDVFAQFARASGLTARRSSRRRRDERDPRREQRRRTSCERARERSGLPIRVLSREAGGALRLPRGGQLDDARRRLRARPRRRLAAARARRRAPRASRSGSWRAGHGAHERALPARPTGRPSAGSSRSCASTSPRELRGGWLAAARRRPARLVGIGGTVRNLAAAAQRAAGPAEPRRAGHGASTARRSTSWSRGSPRCRPPSAASVPGIKPARADLILAGAVVVQGGAARPAASTPSRRPRPACARASSSSACSLRPASRRCSTTCAARAC